MWEGGKRLETAACNVGPNVTKLASSQAAFCCMRARAPATPVTQEPSHVHSLSPIPYLGDDRDIDLYHWSSERFSAAWRTTISVLVAKGRARVGVADAATDWPKRIRDLQFLDHEGDPTAA